MAEPPVRESSSADDASDSTPSGERQQTGDYDAIMRANRRKLALIGLATGGVMSLIVLLCLLLAYLLSTQ